VAYANTLRLALKLWQVESNRITHIVTHNGGWLTMLALLQQACSAVFEPKCALVSTQLS
jgi:hypothetical protein